MVSHQDGDGDNDNNTSKFRLGYVTDVEGNLDFFKDYVSRSNVLEVVEEEKNPDDNSSSKTCLNLRLKDDNCYFVFGGDAVDKGPGDIQLCRALVALKQKYPDRVFLLLGNRDLNKLRFTAELSDEDMKRPLDEIPSPFWAPTAPSLKEYLEKLAASSSTTTTEDGSLPPPTLDELNTKVNRLKYMLKHTMGCPGTFEFRRRELFFLKNNNNNNNNNVPFLEDISDEQVVENMIYEIASPDDGSIRQYIQHATIAVQIGNTFFCHGAVDRHTMKFIPLLDSKFEIPKSKPPPYKLCDNLSEWIQELNKFLQHGLDDFQNRPYWNEDRTSRGGESLLAIHIRASMWGRSIINNCYGDGGCIATESAAKQREDPDIVAKTSTDPMVYDDLVSDAMDTDVAEWLLQNNVQRVVVGHRPTGDTAAVLSAKYTGVEIVSADTSFSDTSADDNRGKAISVVEIVGETSKDNHLEISGTLAGGETFTSVFPRLHLRDGGGGGEIDESVGDSNLGRRLVDGEWWVKAKTPTQYHLCRGHGRNVEHKFVPLADASDFKFK